MGRSISQGSTNSNLSADTTEVYSATGYQAGDLIYNVNGSYGAIPDNFASTATFPINAQQSYRVGGVAGGYTELVEGNNVGCLNSSPAAKLTNGNVVVVWLQGTFTGRSATNIYFKITDINNNEVVAPTVVSSNVTSSYYNYAIVGVTALTGGGFAIAWKGSSDTLVTAVYSNTGTVVAAPSVAVANGMYATVPTLNIISLTNGGYAASFWNSSFNASITQIYTAAGVYVTSCTLMCSTTPNVMGSIGIASRLNGSVHEICVVTHYNSANQQYAIFNATTGAAIGSPTNFSNPFPYSIDVCTNSTDNNFIILVYAGGGTSVDYYKLNTSYVLSSAVTTGLPVNQGVVLFALSTGGFAALSTNGSSFNYVIEIYNGTYVKQNSGVTFTGIIPSWYKSTSIIESSGNLYFYQSPIPQQSLTSQGFYLNGYFAWLFRYKFNLTTFTQVPVTNSVTNTVGSSSALAVSGYARGSSTPNNVAMYANTTTTATATTSQSSGSTFVLSQSSIENNATDSIDSDTLSNGNVVVVYRLNSGTYPIKYAVYNSTGSVVSSGTVSSTSGGASGYPRVCGVAALPNGKFVVTYYSTTSGALNYAVYSSTYTVLNSGTLPTSHTLVAIDADNFYPAVAALTDNRFVVAYQNTSFNAICNVFSDTGSFIWSSGVYISGTSYAMKVTGRPDGGFFVNSYANSSAASRTYLFAKSSTTSYDSVMNFSNSPGGQYYITTNGLQCGLDGSLAIITATGTSSGNIYVYPGAYPQWGSPLTYQSYSGGNSSHWAEVAVGTNGNGTIISYSQQNTNYGKYLGQASGVISTSVPSLYTSGVLRSNPTISGFYDSNFALFTLNSSAYPTISILNSDAITYSATITSGTTISNPIAVSPKTNGTSLIGVSVTSATAGSSGTVQTNGFAKLNSNYSSSTANQSFDFQTVPNTYGVRGFIVGRDVTMMKG